MELESIFSLPNDIQLMVDGDNAAGKTAAVEKLVRLFPNRVSYIKFKDCYGDETDNNYYLQLRWNQQAIDEDTPTTASILKKAFDTAESRARWLPEEKREGLTPRREEMMRRLYELFGLKEQENKYVISLSSGESRKLQLSRALLALPEVLVVDNPFIGLDSATRDQLSVFLGRLTAETGIRVIPIVSRLDVIPDYITHVLHVENGLSGELVPKDEYLAHRPESKFERGDIGLMDMLPVKELASFYPEGERPEIVRCTNVGISYGERTILKDFNWVVREGEMWALNGENGAGKSTLLSLVCADNPQSYACDIELFSHKRGSGESIWDIKRHIGYVSPEMHRAYQKSIPSRDIVASGLFDTVGMFKHASEQQMQTVDTWMRIFGIEDLADRNYLDISSGEQRLVLLARAFVKDPELLILDEPFHGLDENWSNQVRAVIDKFVRRPHKTMVMVSHFPAEYPACIDHSLKLQKRL